MGLGSLISVSAMGNEDLEISNNAALTSLTGLESLTTIGRQLRIQDNPMLLNLTGLSALLDTELVVRNNDGDDVAGGAGRAGDAARAGQVDRQRHVARASRGSSRSMRSLGGIYHPRPICR